MVQRRTKFIFVTGGVVSSLGKGIAAASLGALLENRGLKVSILKLDPYLNVDPGTMNPTQHGEVFVTDDGAETDLDLGHYERFLTTRLNKANSVSAGQIYSTVLENEREGKYLGATVQVIPHITNEIKSSIRAAVIDNCDILIAEVGGTVGDIESLPFIEAIRQMRLDEGPENVMFLHVSYLPKIKAAGELKTKPTQHSVKDLLSIGIQPDVLLLRCEEPAPKEIKEKISLFCNVPVKCVVNAPDASTVYEVPLNFEKDGLDEIVCERLNIWSRGSNLKAWKDVVKKFNNPKHETTVGIVGKYVDLAESYKSINEALIHAGIANQTKINLEFVDSEELTSKNIKSKLGDMKAILVPGGFGIRGTNGMIEAAKYARENNIPYFGICLGLQIAIIEFAKNAAGIAGATSQEFDEASENQVVHIMESQKSVKKKGGTMRLGSYPCELTPNSLAEKIYKTNHIDERHRHRFEVNNAYKEQLEKAGLIFSGLSPDGNLVEMIELKDHPFFVACQFHPELKSRPLDPHPIFRDFIKASLK